MKKFTTLCLILFGFASLSAQVELERQVIGSLGNYFEGSTLQISATAGEAIVTSISNNELLLTQGFHQAELEDITSLQIISDILSNFSVYPNPSSNNFTIKVVTKDFHSLRFEVIDVRGSKMRLITQQLPTDTESNLNINTSNWSPGVYFIRILQEDGFLLGSAQIVITTE